MLILTGWPPELEVEPLGIVQSHRVQGVGPVGDFLARFRDTLGGRAGSLEKALSEKTEEVLADLQKRAKHLGADALLGVQFQSYVISTPRGGFMVMVSAWGVACRRRRKGPSALSSREEPEEPLASPEEPPPEEIDTWFR